MLYNRNVSHAIDCCNVIQLAYITLFEVTELLSRRVKVVNVLLQVGG